MNNFNRTLEVLGKITNKIVNDPTDTRTGITYGEALITHKQMDWLRKVYTMDCGGGITEGGCQSITGNEYEYGISGKPVNKCNSYIIQVFPKTQKAYDDLLNKASLKNAYGKSISLGIESQERDSRILTSQITNTY